MTQLDSAHSSAHSSEQYHGLEIAIIGMAGRFPGADSVAEFWANLLAGKESIQPLSDEFLRQQGATESMLADPQWKKVGAPINGYDQFDAEFFGYSPREAELLDPQQRLFLESAWHALEDAGCDPSRFPGSIGVYAGAGMNGYLFNLYSNGQVRNEVSPYELFVGNDKDFLTTRVSYKLGLTGPSLDIQTACSTSLVAVHLACQSLIAGECDLALAGGVALSRQQGYRPQQGGIYSADGHCRPFDADASGTVAGNGVGTVALKRLDDARAQGDNIIAVIKGSAINNDGNNKVSFTAPSVEAQANVIRAALSVADVPADSIGYVEAHGTGTPLGDPIEMAALNQVFCAPEKPDTSETPDFKKPDSENKCSLGAVKSNIGHLDAAAGIAGLIKTALCVQQGTLPPTLHFSQPNPQIDFSTSVFSVVTEQRNWSAPGVRRAGVSCFGIGGTNAHVVLEQPPQDDSAETASVDTSAHQLLVLSARDSLALKSSAASLAQFLESQINKHNFDQHNANKYLQNLSWTMQQGRKAFTQQRSRFVTDSLESAIESLRALSTSESDFSCAVEAPELVWLIPGQGSQQVAMAKSLYQSDDVFRTALNQCADIANPMLSCSLIELLCDEDDTQSARLNQTAFTQPALFAFQYALAQRWLAWGFTPRALLGHSLGEWVCACLSGVMSLQDALTLVIQRAALMQGMEEGAMLAVLASSEQLESWLNSADGSSEQISIAAINGPSLCVLSGPGDAIECLQVRCRAEGIGSQRLTTSHGFHSPAMEPAAAELRVYLQGIILSAPEIPFISNMSGTWITPEQATDPDYWVQQMLSPVQFLQGTKTVSELGDCVFLELGPGTALTGLVRQTVHHSLNSDSLHTIAALPSKQSQQYTGKALLEAAGECWCKGIAIKWNALHQGSKRKMSLPGYAFQRRRYWIDADAPFETRSEHKEATLYEDASKWVYTPIWTQITRARRFPKPGRPQTWLLFLPAPERCTPASQKALTHLSQQMGSLIENAGFNLFTATSGNEFEQTDYRAFQLNGNDNAQCQQLRSELESRDMPLDHILDFRWLGLGDTPLDEAASLLEQFRVLTSVWSSVGSGSGLGSVKPVQITLFSRGGFNIIGAEQPEPVQALLQGLCQVASQEYPSLMVRQIDLPKDLDRKTMPSAEALWFDLRSDEPVMLSAWRHQRQWQPDYIITALESAPARLPRHIPGIRKQGRYLIVGELSEGLGRIWAEAIAQRCQGELLLASIDHPQQEWLDDLGKAGCSVEYFSLPSSDNTALETLYSNLCEQGTPEGVFFSVPTTRASNTAPLTLMEPRHWQANCEQRLQPVQALIQAMQSSPPRWCCVQSSMSAVLGGVGLGPYAASNHALDALIEQARQQTGQSLFSINWDAVNRDAVEHQSPDQNSTHDTASLHGAGQALQAYSLSAEQAWDVTERILAGTLPGQTAVSRGDLNQRRQQWLTLESSSDVEKATASGAHPRPALATEYVAPRNDMETTLCNLWQELLRLDQVGVDDSFFDLGGQSLLAIQAIGRIKQLYPVQLDMRELLEGTPTVANIATRIQAQLPDQDDLSRMAALMAEVESLSDDDVAALLQDGTQDSKREEH